MKPCVPYKAENILAFEPIGNTQIGGFIGEYFHRFFEKRVLSDYAKTAIFGEAENALRYPHDDDTIVGMWSGEFWGKLEISACRVYEYTKDETLKKFVRDSAKRILSYARPDGYINSYRDSTDFFPPDPDETEKLVGWRCTWNWNIWCRKYTLWGLAECALLTDDNEILSGAHKLARQLIRELHDNGVTSLAQTGTECFKGLPSSSILKPMLILYRCTADPELLDFCIKIAEDWDRDDGRMPNIIRNALLKKPVHTQYPHSEQWAKAYETMSCLDGLAELYRITGTQKYFDAVRYMVDLLAQYEKNVLGSVGFNDIFADAHTLQNAISEPCDVIHWIRILTELFALTKDTRYADLAENAFYNAYTAGISDDGTWGARGVRSSGRHFAAKGQSGCTLNHCCVDNMPRGFLNFSSFAVMSGKDGLYINQFCPFVFEDRNHSVQISCSDGYLENGKVRLDIRTESPLLLHVRVPDCSGDNAFLTVCGDARKIPLTKGTFVELPIENSAQIDLDFDFSAKLHDFTVSIESDSLPDEDFRIKRWLGDYTPERSLPRDCMLSKPRSFITYGPLLLCRSKKLGATEQELFESDSLCGTDPTINLKPIPRGKANVLCRFKLSVANENTEKTFDLCDYGTASDNLDNLDPHFFNLYL